MTFAKRHNLVRYFVVALILFAAGCGSSAEDRVTSTRITADVTGILIEQDGCLRLAAPGRPDGASDAVVFQKDVLEVNRIGDEITIKDLEIPGTPVVWKIGQEIRASGGELRSPDEHAGEGFASRCPGPYKLVSSVL